MLMTFPKTISFFLNIVDFFLVQYLFFSKCSSLFLLQYISFLNTVDFFLVYIYFFAKCSGSSFNNTFFF